MTTIYDMRVCRMRLPSTPRTQFVLNAHHAANIAEHLKIRTGACRKDWVTASEYHARGSAFSWMRSSRISPSKDVLCLIRKERRKKEQNIEASEGKEGMKECPKPK